MGIYANKFSAQRLSSGNATIGILASMQKFYTPTSAAALVEYSISRLSYSDGMSMFIYTTGWTTID
jgi:hypothetical protein